MRNRRAGELQAALQVLTVVRDQLNADRLRCINALTALVRSHDLGVDARRTLTAPQITTVAGWRRREESLGVATARAEAVRLAKRILVLDEEPTDNRDQITELVTAQAPELLDRPGVGARSQPPVILTVWSHPGRIRCEAAFAQIEGTCPIPGSSGNTIRHRLNRGGDRRPNGALKALRRQRAPLVHRAGRTRGMRANAHRAPALRARLEKVRGEGETLSGLVCRGCIPLTDQQVSPSAVCAAAW